jgi:zinc transport system permease protein
LLVCLGLLPQLFAVSADEPFARSIGLPVRLYNIVVVALAAVTVTVSMRTVGLLLVSALMVVPVATANHLVVGFRRALVTAMGLGVLAAVTGTIGSYQFDTAPGALIVVVAIGVFALSWPLGRLLGRRYLPIPEVVDDQPRPVHEVAEGHPHVHDESCGHPSVHHGSHIDYIHHGHRHAAHGDHYDEH